MRDSKKPLDLEKIEMKWKNKNSEPSDVNSFDEVKPIKRREL